MANEVKGEVDLVVEGKTYTLCFSSDAIVRVEQLLGSDIGAISTRGSVESMRALLWGALLKHHPQADLDLASGLLDEYEDGLQGAFEKTARVLRFRLSRVPVSAPFTSDENPVIN